MVHVTGPNKHSAEMILPHTPKDLARWRELGYSKDKLIDAWRRCVDVYARAFPDHALVLNLSPTIDDNNVTIEVVEYAFGRYGQRIFLQNNILLADSNDRRVDWGILKEYATKTTIGFQRQLLRQGKRDNSAGSGAGADPDDTATGAPASASAPPTGRAPRRRAAAGGAGAGPRRATPRRRTTTTAPRHARATSPACSNAGFRSARVTSKSAPPRSGISPIRSKPQPKNSARRIDKLETTSDTPDV